MNDVPTNPELYRDLFLTQPALDALPHHLRDWLNFFYMHPEIYPVVTKNVERMLSENSEATNLLVEGLQHDLDGIVEEKISGFLDSTELLTPPEKVFIRENWRINPELLLAVSNTVLAWVRNGLDLLVLVNDLRSRVTELQEEQAEIRQRSIKSLKEHEGLVLFMELANEIAMKLGMAQGREDYDGFWEDIKPLRSYINMFGGYGVSGLINREINSSVINDESKIKKRGFRKLKNRLFINSKKKTR